jgi:hypothetical protein
MRNDRFDNFNSERDIPKSDITLQTPTKTPVLSFCSGAPTGGNCMPDAAVRSGGARRPSLQE